MNTHDATEAAYKNGYRQGKIDAVREMQEAIKERCIKGGIYPAFVKRAIEGVASEILEEIEYSRQTLLSTAWNDLTDTERWALNLKRLNEGLFGDTRKAKTMARYWRAQEAAGYPCASENARYYEEKMKETNA